MGLFAFAITVWGLNYSVVKVGVTLSPPLWFAFLRALTGLVFSLALLPIIRPGGGLTRSQKLAAFLLGIPGSAVFYGLWNLGATQVAPGLASVFIYTYPLWALFLSIPILKDWPSLMKTGAAFLGFFGVALTSQIGITSVPTAQLGAVAELIAAGFGFALMNVCFKRLFNPDQLIRANVWQLTGSLVVLAPWAFITSSPTNTVFGLNLLLVLIWVGGIGTAMVYVAFFTLMAKYSVSSLTAYFFLVVVVALLSSYFISGETIDTLEAAGVAAIILAIYLVGRSDRPKLAVLAVQGQTNKGNG